MAVRVNKDNFDSEVIGVQDTAVVADFYSDSCVPCKRMSPVLAEIEEEFEGNIKLVKININFDTELAERYEVQSVPTLVFFKDGEEKERISGAVSRDKIADAIHNLI